MKLVTEKGELTLPADFSFEIEKNSAFFSEEGSASIGASIPATVADQAKLGYPGRIARKSRFLPSFPASIQKGVFQKKGVLVVATASEAHITCSMALEDSELYAKHKDKKLREVFADKVLTTYTTPADWSSYLVAIFQGNKRNPDFKVVPVAVNYDEKEGRYQVNNEPDKKASSSMYGLIHGPRVVKEGSNNVTVPEGYGMAPFLTLEAFFSLIFSQLGYNVGRNCFGEHPVLKTMLLLHNCSDVVCNGRIAYADLVPNKSVSEILEWMNKKFHAQIAVDPESNTVDILLMEDVLSTHSDHDLTSEIIGKPSFSYAQSSRVVITPDTSLDGAEAAADTLQDLLTKYGTFIAYNEEDFAGLSESSLALRAATGQFYEVKSYSKKVVGSNYFRYDRGNSDASESFDPEDVMPPMVFVDGILMPYVGERKHRNTVYKNSKQDTDQDIIIAQYAGRSSTGKYCYATTQAYDDAGKLRNDGYTCNAEEMYFTFFGKYGDILLNNKVTVSGEFNLPIETIFKYDLYKLKQYNGQMLLPTYLKYEVGRKIRALEAKFILVKQFSDGVHDEPTPIPEAKLRWAFNNTEYEAITEQEPPFGMDYIFEWADEDQYKVLKPEFSLPVTPSYLGEKSYSIERVLDMWEEDLRAGAEQGRRYVGKRYFSQWYDAVQM